MIMARLRARMVPFGPHHVQGRDRSGTRSRADGAGAVVPPHGAPRPPPGAPSRAGAAIAGGTCWC